MAAWHESIPASSVVLLVPRLDDDAPPPIDLPMPPRPSTGTRVLVVLLVVLAAMGCFGGVLLLWSSDSPGIWFNLIFTVMGTIFGLGIVAAVVSWHSTARQEELAKAAWLSAPPSYHEHAIVTDRKVNIQSESGVVNRIGLLVHTGQEQLAATWRGRRADAILQAQVPGPGSRVRLWRSSAGPLVIEVADPTVVPTQDSR